MHDHDVNRRATASRITLAASIRALADALSTACFRFDIAPEIDYVR
ncbi:MAG: hypothetical protein ACP5XB_24465 [Isosphaeraceae bacterium]